MQMSMMRKRMSSINGSVYPDRFINYFLKPNYYKYNDKTKFIEKVFENNFTELILCPRNYGKTFNMESLKYFVSCNNLIDEKVDKNTRLEFFKNLDVSKNKEFFDAHFAKYPVIFINFKELDENSYADNLEKFKYLVSLQYEQIHQFLQIPEYKDNLTTIHIKFIEDYFTNYRNLNQQLTLNSCKDLVKILLKLTKQNPFLIINDYDYPLLNSFRKGFYNEMMSFMQSFLNNTIKNNNYINKSLITGVNLVDHYYLFSQVSNLSISNYDNKEDKYFGFFTDYNNLIKDENISITADNLQIKNFIMSSIEGKVYIPGIELVEDLKNKSEKLIKDQDKNSGSDQNISRLSINLSSADKLSAHSIYSYLNYNGLLDSKGKILNERSAKIINEILPVKLLEDPFNSSLDFDKKLAYSYYAHISNKKIDSFLEYLKKLFEFASKSLKSKNLLGPNILPNSNLIFKNENELEAYLIDIMTIDMNNENKDEINIIRVDDDDMTKVSKELKKFTLITYDKKNMAVFLKVNKYKIEKKTTSEVDLQPKNKDEIDELMSNPNINNLSAPSFKSKPFGKKTVLPSVDIPTELKKINDTSLKNINKQEAINFLLKISTEYDKVFFISVSNYQKLIDYSIDIINIEE